MEAELNNSELGLKNRKVSSQMEYEMQKWQFPTGIKRGSSLETVPERHAAEHLTLFSSKG